ncbi:MAG: YkgJ family cysteine cluster protein [Bdellovibrionales bacterium]|nr:YkgJ family cysteine cluster protein [Bdellovibrionales bacterium]
MGSRKGNPCVGCGACCAFFRVQFYWREANKGESEHVVPPGMFEDLDLNYRCMKGTGDKHHPKCNGLKGRIGRDAACSIYTQRPSPCRAFQASFSDGKPNPRCDEARRAHGLKPLRREDWEI